MSNKITFLDVETTGLHPTIDRVVQVSVKNDTASLTLTLNPQMPISKEASDIHGITDDQVVNLHTFAQVYTALVPFFEPTNCEYICGYNVAFDFKFMQAEFVRVGLMLDSKSYKILDPFAIHKALCPNDLASMYKRYTGKTLEGGHNSEVDMLACVEILNEQLKRTKSTVDGLVQLSGFTNRTIGGWLEITENGYILLMGKYQGQSLSHVANTDPEYIKWITQAKDISFEELVIIKRYVQ